MLCLQKIKETGFLDRGDDDSAITTSEMNSNREDQLCINGVSVTSMSKYKITIPISQCLNLKTAVTKALIDCRAEGKFVDSSLVDWKQVCRLKKPIPVRNVDGTSNKAGALRYKIQISYNVQQKQFKDWFYVTKLGDQKMILGLPWLHEINPHIDWSTGTVRFLEERKANNEPEEDESLEDKDIETYLRFVQKMEEVDENDDLETDHLWIQAKMTSQALAHEHEDKTQRLNYPRNLNHGKPFLINRHQNDSLYHDNGIMLSI